MQHVGYHSSLYIHGIHIFHYECCKDFFRHNYIYLMFLSCICLFFPLLLFFFTFYLVESDDSLFGKITCIWHNPPCLYLRKCTLHQNYFITKTITQTKTI